MTIENFITKAIEGGWIQDWAKNYLFLESGVWSVDPPYMESLKEHFLRIVLDPKAWQAVGKVSGWKLHETCGNCIPDWQDFMHAMINALCEGKDIESFLAQL